jgi:CheY-like chemotaxis protein
MMARSILVVNDNSTERKMLRVALELEGFHVIESNDGLSAIARMESEPPDLILQEVRLPDIDGLQLAGKLRACSGGHAVPIIGLYGVRLPAEYAQSDSAYFDELLLKATGDPPPLAGWQ